MQPLEGIRNRAGKNITINHGAIDIDLIGARHKAKISDVAIVFSNVFTMEAFDRPSINLNRNGDNLESAK
jgi:beta-glucosidase